MSDSQIRELQELLSEDPMERLFRLSAQQLKDAQAAGEANPPCTPHEILWRDAGFCSESEFLRCNRLSIDKEEDRAEGRLLVREFMEEQRQDQEHASSEAEEVEFFTSSQLADHDTDDVKPKSSDLDYARSGDVRMAGRPSAYDARDCEDGVAAGDGFIKGGEKQDHEVRDHEVQHREVQHHEVQDHEVHDRDGLSNARADCDGGYEDGGYDGVEYDY